MLNKWTFPEHQEVWASGVTYLRSRDARMAESGSADVYDLVYAAERPELFFKAAGWCTGGHSDTIRPFETFVPVKLRTHGRWDRVIGSLRNLRPTHLERECRVRQSP